jgi:hypothetical protein
MVVVDTNVLLDIVNDDPAWLTWSANQLVHLSRIGRMIINPIVYAELSISFLSLDEVDLAVTKLNLTFLDIPREAAFIAAKAFLQYRRKGGTRTNVLPDFFIGAHAAVLKSPLLTRDPRRYATYFPTVRLITP